MDVHRTAGPLANVSVVDLTSILMGPYTTQLLGDMGADVVKVEPPQGDMNRQIGPMRSPGMGPLYLNTNRSKRSLVLDLKRNEGLAVLERLLKTSDVLVYNMRPQAMERLGLGYEAVRSINPRIIYAGVFGFGQTGPYAARPAYDDLIQAAVTLPMLTRRAGSDEPRYLPIALCDRIVGMSAANAILAALWHRHSSGVGQRIDVPMFETMAAFVLADHLAGLTFEPPLDDGGYGRLLSKWRRPYKTRDGYVAAMIYSDKQWASFMEATGQADRLRTDSRLASLETRSTCIDDLYGEISGLFTARTTAEWIELLVAIDVPVMPLHDLQSIQDDPHLVATGFFTTVEHPTEGRLRSMRVPSTWSDTQPSPTRHAPRLGENSAEILGELGYAQAEIDALASSGVTSSTAT